MKPIRATVLVLPLLLIASAPAEDRFANFASHSGFYGFIALGSLLPLARDKDHARTNFLRNADSLVVTTLLTEGLKETIRTPRPDGRGHDAFPSGHSSASFSVAAMESAFHPNEAPFWYAGAAVIAHSRIDVGAHTWGEVLAGSALGYGVAQFELHQPKGILIAPFFGPEGKGLTMSGRF